MKGERTQRLDITSGSGQALTVEVVFGEEGSRLECVAIRLRSRDGKPINATTFRAIKPDALIRRARHKVLEASQAPPAHVSPEVVRRVDARLAARPGPSLRWTAADLAKVAETYVDAWRKGEKKLQAVRKAMRLKDVRAASKLVSRARSEGFLAPTTRGKPSGQMASGDVAVSHTVSAKVTASRGPARRVSRVKGEPK